MTNHPNNGRRVGDECPECLAGALALRKNKRTKGYFLGCDQFPTCPWACLPNASDVSAARQRAFVKRRSWAIVQEQREQQSWERFYAELEVEGRASFLLDDEQQDPIYSWWDALMDGRII